MTPNAQPWWVLFPLAGLDITDETHDLLDPRPLFGDASIISRKHVPQLVRRLTELDRIHYPQEPQIIAQIEKLPTAGETDFSAFIAVRRRGIVSRTVDKGKDKLVAAARRRAYQITALLTIAILTHWRFSQTCALVEQLHRGTKGHVLLELSRGDISLNVSFRRSFSVLSGSGVLSWSRAEIKNLLDQQEFLGLKQAILFEKTLDEKLRNPIQQAAIRLSDAIHSIIPASKLLGAVTALELMLGTDQDILRRRLALLIGRPIPDPMKAIFEARNNYVHEGEEVKSEGLAAEAIFEAMACLLRFANVATKFKSKGELWEYLDFMERGYALYQTWDVARQQAFDTLPLHNVLSPVFPFDREEVISGEDDDEDDDLIVWE